MAVDMALFCGVLSGGNAVLRFYGWDPPGLSLGRFQRRLEGIDLEACRAAGIPLVRRPTGGRAVLHHRELTYSIASRFEGPFAAGGILETYSRIADALAAGLALLGVTVGRAAGRASGRRDSPNCFSDASPRELTWRGRKLCGSAQRRERGGFLQHGSLLKAVDPELWRRVFAVRDGAAAASLGEILGREPGEEELAGALRRGFEQVLGVTLVDSCLSLPETRDALRNTGRIAGAPMPSSAVDG